MERKPFALLAGATVVSVVLAAGAVLVHQRGTAPPPEAAAPLIPGLSPQINTVIGLTVKGANGALVTIHRTSPTAADWGVDEKSGYPVNPDLLKRTILALADGRTEEPRTAKPELYGRIGVEDVTAPGAQSLRLAVRTADGKEWPALLVGKPGGGDAGAGTEMGQNSNLLYVRREGEAQSWLANARLTGLSADPMRWIIRELPSLAREKVKSVTIMPPGIVRMEAYRDDPKQTEFKVSGLPAGAKPKTGTINELAGLLEFLSFEDVAHITPEDARPEAFSVSVQSFDGLILTLQVFSRDNVPWLTITTALDAEVAGKLAPEVKAELESQVKRWQELHAAWRYRLAEFSARELTRRPDDFVIKETEAAPPH